MYNHCRLYPNRQNHWKKQCGGVYFLLYSIVYWILIQRKLTLPELLFSVFTFFVTPFSYLFSKADFQWDYSCFFLLVTQTIDNEIRLFRTESVFHTELNSVWVDRTKSNFVQPKCSSHVILFPQIFFTIQKWIFTVYHFDYRPEP